MTPQDKHVSNFLKKNWIHLFIWMIMLIYVVTAPTLYARFFLRNGKPVSLEQDLPASTAQMQYSVDRLDPIIIDNQRLFKLWGWAFILDESDLSDYERYIVLKSDTRTYFFLAESIARPDVKTAFPNLTQDVTNSGFQTYLAREAIQQGTYQIGLLFTPMTKGITYYTVANKEIVKTANQMKLIIP